MKSSIRWLVALITEHFQIRGSSRFVWMARKFLLPEPHPVVRLWKGARMRVDREVRSNALYPFHLHSFDLILIAQSFLKPGYVFLDVGGNAGYVTVIGAKLVGPTGRVLSVEPQPQMLDLLRENVSLNDMSHVTIFPNAISPIPGLVMFSVATDPGLSRLTMAKSAAMTESYQVEVEALPLDDIVTRSGVSKVDFVKMDIEGFELEAVKSAPVLLSVVRPVWVLEVNRYSLESIGGSAEELRGMFAASDYVIYGIESHQDKWISLGRKPSLEAITNLPDLGSYFDILCVPREKVKEWLETSRNHFRSVSGAT